VAVLVEGPRGHRRATLHAERVLLDDALWSPRILTSVALRPSARVLRPLRIKVLEAFHEAVLDQAVVTRATRRAAR
jgi:hypothetical protein